jgi:hypothetical protein
MGRDGHRWNDCLDGLLGGCLNRNTLLFGALGLFLAHQMVIAWGRSAVWADSFLDPFLFLPVALGAAGWLLRRWNAQFRWRIPFILGAWAATSFVFEYWIPSFDPRFTADAWDVMSFALGASAVAWTESRGK